MVVISFQDHSLILLKNLLSWYPKRDLNTSRAASQPARLRDGCFVNCYKRSLLPTSSLLYFSFVEEQGSSQCQRSSRPQALLSMLISWEIWEAMSPLRRDRGLHLEWEVYTLNGRVHLLTLNLKKKKNLMITFYSYINFSLFFSSI